jgi:hypothetical protein
MSGSFANDPVNPQGAENTVFKRNTIFAKQVAFSQAQWPDPIMLQVAQALAVTNSTSAGQIDYAANNRVDSRKTAAEIKSATNQRTMLSSTQLVPFATCIRDAYTRFWEILQSRILAGYITAPPDTADLIAANYYLTPAGDIEVLKREETLANLQAFYPIVAQTPIGPKVLARIMELMFPREARMWTPLLEAPDTAAITAQLLAVIEAFPKDNLSPEEQQNLQMIIQHAKQAIGNNPNGEPPNGVASAPGNGGPPQIAGNPSPALPQLGNNEN